ncbi:iron chelate uptake ABC transporter family permease subunit [Streptomyces sp. RY43-2]|uniref:Iron chelate uptake ABC transporter family permease subunit n=1 Tax=Streptomyces macrolidinus TaxID=2952607 RepID=A0ABT0ZC84_9ACTN|nr:iron chelate uptake ABC transporter family permease subunit [Streptomyces macrolidinus]MCN9240421.1 iron chelate uptake ABC transporter family permease subunit [Streptomyces macrolidinus]
MTRGGAVGDISGVGGVGGGRPAGHVVLRAGQGSFLVHRRALVVGAVLTVLLAGAGVTSLCVGESFVAPSEVVRVLLGMPSPDQLVVGTLRLPRLVTGLLVGAAFGMSGALIQTMARNPLASPDVIGVTHGAGAATVAAMTFGLTSYTVLPYVSVAGGLLAALLVYLFAWRGGLTASRFVLIGIGISVALGSLTRLLVTKGDYLVAQQAKTWLTGSLNGRGYDQAAPLATVLLLMVPFLLWAARAQRGAAFDDDTATALGIRLGRVRVGLSVLGVVLASVATGAAGPVDFVALLAPQIARRLTRTPHVPLVCSALTGALIVVVADLLARRLLSPLELPVGVFTALVGAPYLMWLIVRTRSSRSGGNA